MKKTFATLISVSALALGALAQAPSPAPAPEQPAPPPQNREHNFRSGGPGGERMRMGGGMENLGGGMEALAGAMMQGSEVAKKLNVTPDQQEAIKRLATEQRAKMIDLQAALQKAALKQTDLLMADPLDEAALMKAVEETSAASTVIAKARIQMLLEVRKVLTDEQRRQLREIAAKRQLERAQPGMGRGMREGRGGERPREKGTEQPGAPLPPAPVAPPAPPAPPAPAN